MTRLSATFAMSTALAGALLGSAPASAASNKIVSGMGHDLAVHLCTSCHLVEPGQTNTAGHVGGPSFQTVANRPTVTEDSLRRHLRTTHSNAMIPLAMPNPQLTEDELVKVIDYVISLRK